MATCASSSESLPTDSSHKEAPSFALSASAFLTPHKIVLLVLIDTFCTNVHLHSQNALVTSFMPWCLRHINSPNTTFSEQRFTNLCAQLKHMVVSMDEDDDDDDFVESRTTWTMQDVLLDRLPEIQASLDAFETLFSDLEALVLFADMEVETQDDQMYLDESSVLGLFVRKCCLAFHTRSFGQVWALYRQFRVHVALDSMANGEGFSDSFHRNHNLKRILPNHVVSIFDIEQYLDAHLEVLTSQGGDSSQLIIFQRHLDSFQQLYPGLPKIQFSRYLYAARTGNYEAALYHLHRYFDYYNSQGNRTLYQYALLNLACLEAQFEHHQEARRILQEAIDVARENRDRTCLCYASFWLHHLGHPSPTITSSSTFTEAQTLGSLTGQTEELQLWDIRCLTELQQAQYHLRAGSPPRQVFESTLRCELMQRHHQVPKMLGLCYALVAAVWDIYGFTSTLSILYTQLQLTYGYSQCPDDGVVTGYCKVGQYLAERGAWTALKELDHEINSRYPGNPSTLLAPWRRCLAECQLQRCVYQQGWDGDTGSLFDSLSADPPSGISSDSDSKGTIKSLPYLWALIRQGQYALALQSLLQKLNFEGETNVQLRTVMMYAMVGEIYLDSSDKSVMVKLAVFACIATAILATSTLGVTTHVRRSPRLLRRAIPAGVAVFNGVGSYQLSGEVTLTTTGEGVEVHVNLNGLGANSDYHYAVYQDDFDSPNPCQDTKDIYHPCDIDNGNLYQCHPDQAFATCKAGDFSGRFGNLPTDAQGTVTVIDMLLNRDVNNCVDDDVGSVFAIGIRDVSGPLIGCAILQ
ncbi:APC5 protein [Dispira simplex]|nr:APC5 protein [Dispira simplex]